MPVSTETGDAVSSGHLHNISPQHEGGLCDVVFVDAGLGGHGHHLGLFVRTKHGELGILTLLWRGRRGWPAPPALLLLLIGGIWVVPWLVGRGQQSSSGVQQGHSQNASFESDHSAWRMSITEVLFWFGLETAFKWPQNVKQILTAVHGKLDIFSFVFSKGTVHDKCTMYFKAKLTGFSWNAHNLHWISKGVPMWTPCDPVALTNIVWTLKFCLKSNI